jgi:hypothetical protein
MFDRQVHDRRAALLLTRPFFFAGQCESVYIRAKPVVQSLPQCG